MTQSLTLNIGYGEVVVARRIVAIISYTSAPMKRMKDDAKKDNRLIDATRGRKTRSVIIMDSRHVILSAMHVETISHRFKALEKSD